MTSAPPHAIVVAPPSNRSLCSSPGHEKKQQVDMLALLTCAQRATYLLGGLLTCTYRAGYVATYLSTYLATYLLACLFDLLLGVRGLSQSQCLTGISTSSFPLPTSPSVCMFDKLYLTLNFKSKVSCDIFTNKNQSQSTYKFHFKMPLQCWVTQYFRKYNVLNNQNTISIYYKQTNKLSIERKQALVSHVSPNVEDGSPIHCIPSKPTKSDPHKSIKGPQVEPIMQVAFDCILFGKPSLTNNYTCLNEYNFLP